MPRAPAISKLSISEIQRMLNKRLEQLRSLQEQIRQTLTQLGQIEQQATEEIRQELRAVQVRDGMRRAPRAVAPAKRKGRGAQPEAGSLREYILKVLRGAGRAMRPKEVEQAVLDAGYKTTSQRFSVIVNQTLTKLVEQGQVKRDPATRTYTAA